MAGLLGHVDLCTSLLEERGACLLPRNSSGSHRPLASLLQKMVKAEDALLYADVGVVSTESAPGLIGPERALSGLWQQFPAEARRLFPRNLYAELGQD